MNTEQQQIPTTGNDRQISPATGSNISDVASPEGPGIKVDNVNTSLTHYLLHTKLLQFVVGLLVIIAWEIGVLHFGWHRFVNATSQANNKGQIIVVAMLLPAVLGILWIVKIQKKFEDTLLQGFARTNGYTFEADKTDAWIDQQPGSIFHVPDASTGVSDILTGTYKGMPMQFALCDVTIEMNRRSVTYQTTAVELDIPYQLPDVMLVHKSFSWNRVHLAHKYKGNAISLEGDFDNYFTLYCKPNHQDEALEIFTPDTMQLAEAEASHLTVELTQNRIYVYADSYIDNIAALTQTFSILDHLSAKIIPVAAVMQYADDDPPAAPTVPAQDSPEADKTV